jgi:hypothetical protein
LLGSTRSCDPDDPDDVEPARSVHIYLDLAEAKPHRVHVDVYGENGCASVAITAESWKTLRQQIVNWLHGVTEEPLKQANSFEHTFILEVSKSDLAHTLTSYGAEGWELVSVTTRGGAFDLFFKRREHK